MKINNDEFFKCAFCGKTKTIPNVCFQRVCSGFHVTFGLFLQGFWKENLLDQL